MGGLGRRVSIVDGSQATIEPGGVRADGEPYEQTVGPTVAVRTFWVVEIPEGWRVRGFDVEGDLDVGLTEE